MRHVILCPIFTLIAVGCFLAACVAIVGRVRDAGLILFLFLVCPSGPVIFFDAGLEWAGVPTISEYVRENTPWSVAIITALAVGVAGLGIHFWWPLKWGG